MGRVVSLGSINVDRFIYTSQSQLEDLADKYGWFPDCGETVIRSEIPADFPTDADTIQLGGKGANQAVAASRAGAAVTMLGMVGPDAADEGALEALEDDGIQTGDITRRFE